MNAPANPQSAPSPYCSVAELAARLGVDRKTIDRQRQGMTEGVHFLRLGRRVVIHVENALAYFAGREARDLNEGTALLEAFIAKARPRA